MRQKMSSHYFCPLLFDEKFLLFNLRYFGQKSRKHKRPDAAVSKKALGLFSTQQQQKIVNQETKKLVKRKGPRQSPFIYHTFSKARTCARQKTKSARATLHSPNGFFARQNSSWSQYVFSAECSVTCYETENTLEFCTVICKSAISQNWKELATKHVSGYKRA